VGNIRNAVFLDRDGVINEAIVIDGKPTPPPSLAEFNIRPNVEEALEKLVDAGYLNIVVTNQPDVRTGKQSREVVDSFHDKLRSELPIHDVFACFHIDQDQCNCRKPQAGMLVQAAKKWSIDLSNSHMVGDRWKDIEAGQLVGCTTFWLPGGYDEPSPKSPDYTVKSLFEASVLIANLDGQRTMGTRGDS
jgi:D-glycero-D-manno-heptose 1,7-bisphosphate phosphatase